MKCGLEKKLSCYWKMSIEYFTTECWRVLFQKKIQSFTLQWNRKSSSQWAMKQEKKTYFKEDMTQYVHLHKVGMKTKAYRKNRKIW